MKSVVFLIAKVPENLLVLVKIKETLSLSGWLLNAGIEAWTNIDSSLVWKLGSLKSKCQAIWLHDIFSQEDMNKCPAMPNKAPMIEPRNNATLSLETDDLFYL